MLRLPQFWAALLAMTMACATTPGARPHEMSAAQHEREAEAHARAAGEHEVGWTSVTQPTPQDLREAEAHRRAAADHRAASAALREAEARACAGLPQSDRDTSPFEHTEDIASVAPLTAPLTGPDVRFPGVKLYGAVVTFRAVPGMTAEWLQRVVDCHLARNAALGHSVPEMPDCPLVPRGVTAQVRSTGTGFAVEVRSDDPESAREILARAQRLQQPGAPTSSGRPAPG